MAQRVQHHGLDVHYVPNFYSVERTHELIEHLQNVEYNSEEDSQVFVYGKWFNIPRQQVAYGDSGLKYHFSGNTVYAKQWTPWLEDIRTELAEWCYENMPEIDWDADDNPSGTLPSFVLVNHYRNRNDKIGLHSDDEKDLAGLLNVETGKREVIIISLSFGVTREFAFQHRNAKAMKKSFMLRNGDLCVMRGDTQKFWMHTIREGLPEGKFDGSTSRWNLTFRWMVQEAKPVPKIEFIVGTKVTAHNGLEFKVIEISKKGTPKVQQISGDNRQIKNLHWSANKSCWQLFGKPVKWISK